MNNLRSFLLAIVSLILLSQTVQAHYDRNIGRFINRDPLGDFAFFAKHSSGKSEQEQWTLWWESLGPAYAFVKNSPLSSIDAFGLRRWHVDELHTYVIVEVWDDCCNEVVGYKRIEFGPKNPIALIPPFFMGPGKVKITDSEEPDSSSGNDIPSDCHADRILLGWANLMAQNPPIYSFWVYNCRHFSGTAQNIGLGN